MGQKVLFENGLNVGLRGLDGLVSCFYALVSISRFFLPVLNPSFRFRWIKLHWEDHYYDWAVDRVSSIVSPTNFTNLLIVAKTSVRLS